MRNSNVCLIFALLCASVSSSSLFRASVIFSLSFICDINRMARYCTISMSLARHAYEGFHTDAAYSICGLQRLVYAKSRACLGALCRARLIMPSCLLVLDTLFCICVLNFKCDCIITPRYFTLFNLSGLYSSVQVMYALSIWCWQ